MTFANQTWLTIGRAQEGIMPTTSKCLRFISLVLWFGCGLTSGAQAQLTPIKFRLDWVWQAPQSIWTLAHERGYFRDEGLEVTIDRGYGGSHTVGSVAACIYEFAFSLINNAILITCKNPTPKVQCVFLVSDP